MLADSANCGAVRKDGIVEQIVLAGGQIEPTHAPILVTIYDVQSDTWVRGRFINIWCFGGFEIFNTKISGENLPKSINYAASVEVGDTFLLIGGIGKDISDTIYKYDNGNWLEIPQKLSVARFYSTAIIVPTDTFTLC